MALRLGVVGVGHLGKHHARILSSLPSVELTAVADINRARADDALLTALADAATWRRQGDMLVLAGSRQLRFRLNAN